MSVPSAYILLDEVARARGGATERLRQPWHRRLASFCRARAAPAAPLPARRPAWLLVARAALWLDLDAPLGFVVGERRRSEEGRRRSVWRHERGRRAAELAPLAVLLGWDPVLYWITGKIPYLVSQLNCP